MPEMHFLSRDPAFKRLTVTHPPKATFALPYAVHSRHVRSVSNSVSTELLLSMYKFVHMPAQSMKYLLAISAIFCLQYLSAQIHCSNIRAFSATVRGVSLYLQFYNLSLLSKLCLGNISFLLWLHTSVSAPSTCLCVFLHNFDFQLYKVFFIIGSKKIAI